MKVITRREFIRRAVVSSAALTIVPRRVLGGQGYVPPSDEPTKAVIGVGGMGRVHLRYPGSRLLAVCDVDSEHLRTALEIAGPGVRGYRDFREVLDRPDIDIVHIVTPPHWHALMSIAATEAGKDIWCEKPMTRTIGEGIKVVEAVEKHSRIFRINTWFRFQDVFYGLGTAVKPVKKAAAHGLFGWPLKVTVSGVTGFDWKFYWSGRTYLPPQLVPPELDYDFWLGPAPLKPYHPHRVHGSFRGYWDYDGGGLGDMGMHYLDPVQFILEKVASLPDPEPHPEDFSEAVRKRKKFVLNEQNGHRSATLVNLAKIAVRLGRRLRFDPGAQRFIGDDEANRYIDEPMRTPWHL
jgi:myo-inositol 2-dehydrogenase/D-chiro-inositol 1-dehydrogenase